MQECDEENTFFWQTARNRKKERRKTREGGKGENTPEMRRRERERETEMRITDINGRRKKRSP